MEKKIDKEFMPLVGQDTVGFSVWRNPGNQAVVVELHYTADPKKRDPEWRARESAGMPRADWDREYELAWETYEGTPMHKDYRDSLHVWERDRAPETGLPIIRGWDSSGLSPACVFIQLVGRRVTVLDELVRAECPAARFVPEVVEFSNRYYSSFTFLDFCDPAGAQRSATTTDSYFSIMIDNDLTPICGSIALAKRIGAVSRVLSSLYEGFPLLMLNPRCKILRQALGGGYQIGKDGKPVKNEFSHVAEALQYPLSSLDHKMLYRRQNGSKPIPEPGYATRRG